MLYGVEYRSMHTAMHGVLVFDSAPRARIAARNLCVNEVLVEDMGVVGAIAGINFRHPPEEFHGQPLKILNADHIPDLYNVR